MKVEYTKASNCKNKGRITFNMTTFEADMIVRDLKTLENIHISSFMFCRKYFECIDLFESEIIFSEAKNEQ